MAGVRITHATETSCTYVLVDASRVYGQPIVCLACKVTHAFKTYHINVDGNGGAIVSPEVVERLKAIGLVKTGFTIANEVKKPPKQVLAMAGKGSGRSIVRSTQLKEPH